MPPKGRVKVELLRGKVEASVSVDRDRTLMVIAGMVCVTAIVVVVLIGVFDIFG